MCQTEEVEGRVAPRQQGLDDRGIEARLAFKVDIVPDYIDVLQAGDADLWRNSRQRSPDRARRPSRSFS
jgi:hypothetical protein